MSSLTPEERRRIYEEEKTRLEAQAQLNRDSQVKAENAKAEQRGNYWRGVGIIAAIVFGIAIVSSVLGGGSRPSSDSTGPRAPAAVKPVEYGLMAFDTGKSTWKFMGRVFTSDTQASLPNYTVSRDPLAECIKWARDLHNLLSSARDLGATGCQDFNTGKIVRPTEQQ